jgi:hypothetical protein
LSGSGLKSAPMFLPSFSFNSGSAIFVALRAPFVKLSEASLKNPMSKPFEKKNPLEALV